jgi:hypothetical protein
LLSAYSLGLALPFVAAGLAFDRLLGQRIARSTMRELLERLALAMEQRERNYRAGDASQPSSGSRA